jgi:hypothetical protein
MILLVPKAVDPSPEQLQQVPAAAQMLDESLDLLSPSLAAAVAIGLA